MTSSYYGQSASGRPASSSNSATPGSSTSRESSYWHLSINFS
jgi:hypothetical protein